MISFDKKKKKSNLAHLVSVAHLGASVVEDAVVPEGEDAGLRRARVYPQRAVVTRRGDPGDSLAGIIHFREIQR